LSFILLLFTCKSKVNQLVIVFNSFFPFKIKISARFSAKKKRKKQHVVVVTMLEKRSFLTTHLYYLKKNIYIYIKRRQADNVTEASSSSA